MDNYRMSEKAWTFLEVSVQDMYLTVYSSQLLTARSIFSLRKNEHS